MKNLFSSRNAMIPLLHHPPLNMLPKEPPMLILTPSNTRLVLKLVNCMQWLPSQVRRRRRISNLKKIYQLTRTQTLSNMKQLVRVETCMHYQPSQRRALKRKQPLSLPSQQRRSFNRYTLYLTSQRRHKVKGDCTNI